jgi:hypothetical protein
MVMLIWSVPSPFWGLYCGEGPGRTSSAWPDTKTEEMILE